MCGSEGKQITYALVVVRVLGWGGKCDEFFWDDPIQIAIFDLLVMLILVNIEGIVVEPAQLDSILEPPETVQYLH
jgi:hypothetical protein